MKNDFFFYYMEGLKIVTPLDMRTDMIPEPYIVIAINMLIFETWDGKKATFHQDAVLRRALEVGKLRTGESIDFKMTPQLIRCLELLGWRVTIEQECAKITVK